jgi:hypothetical protein
MKTAMTKAVTLVLIELILKEVDVICGGYGDEQ